jgi:hypothetical protein
VGQTTASASASASGSSAVLYINGTPVLQTTTADAGGSSTPSSTGVGGYINSGMGGDVADASSDETSANATDGSVTPSTGDGSKAVILSWSCGGMAVGFIAARVGGEEVGAIGLVGIPHVLVLCTLAEYVRHHVD